MNDDMVTLIDKYVNGDATESERKIVDAWYLLFDTNPGIADQLSPAEIQAATAESFSVLASKLELY